MKNLLGKNIFQIYSPNFSVSNFTGISGKRRNLDENSIYQSQLKIFFGLYSPKSDINNYPDLSIIDMSDALREGYRLKLKEMTINTTNNKIKKDAFF